jgi:hypothetical protein
MEYDGFKLRKTLGYWVLCKGYSKTVYLHRYVWEKAYGEIPSGMVIHHKDGDRGNYSLDNLEMISKSDHRRIHAGWIKSGGGWYAKPCKVCGELKPLTEFYPMGEIWQARCKVCHDAASTEYDKKNIEKTRKRKRDYWHRKKANLLKLDI